jgi:hypothetical protein
MDLERDVVIQIAWSGATVSPCLSVALSRGFTDSRPIVAVATELRSYVWGPGYGELVLMLANRDEIIGEISEILGRVWGLLYGHRQKPSRAIISKRRSSGPHICGIIPSGAKG